MVLTARIYKPSKTKIDERAIFGILTFRPNKAANDVKSMGPRNHASGIFKNSAINAPGIDIRITKTTSSIKNNQNRLENEKN